MQKYILNDELNALIGSQLDAKFIEEEIEINGKKYPNKRLKFADGVLNKLKEKLNELGYENVRIMYYGGVYTQDIRMDRLCVKVGDDGVIKEVYFG